MNSVSDQFKALCRLKIPTNPWYVFTYVAASEIHTDAALDPHSPFANMVLLGTFSSQEKAHSYTINLGKTFTHLNFFVGHAMKIFPMSLSTSGHEDVHSSSMTIENWEKMGEDQLVALTKTTDQFKKISEQINQERVDAEDPESLDYFRANFVQTVQNHLTQENAADTLEQARKGLEMRRQNCLGYLGRHPDAVPELVSLFEERLRERGEMRLGRLLIEHLQDQEEGIPKILIVEKLEPKGPEEVEEPEGQEKTGPEEPEGSEEVDVQEEESDGEKSEPPSDDGAEKSENPSPEIKKKEPRPQAGPQNGRGRGKRLRRKK